MLVVGFAHHPKPEEHGVRGTVPTWAPRSIRLSIRILHSCSCDCVLSYPGLLPGACLGALKDVAESQAGSQVAASHVLYRK